MKEGSHNKAVQAFIESNTDIHSRLMFLLESKVEKDVSPKNPFLFPENKHDLIRLQEKAFVFSVLVCYLLQGYVGKSQKWDSVSIFLKMIKQFLRNPKNWVLCFGKKKRQHLRLIRMKSSRCFSRVVLRVFCHQYDN